MMASPVIQHFSAALKNPYFYFTVALMAMMMVAIMAINNLGNAQARYAKEIQLSDANHNIVMQDVRSRTHNTQSKWKDVRLRAHATQLKRKNDQLSEIHALLKMKDDQLSTFHEVLKEKEKVIQLLERKLDGDHEGNTMAMKMKHFVYGYGPYVLAVTTFAGGIIAALSLLSNHSFTMAAAVECGVNQPAPIIVG